MIKDNQVCDFQNNCVDSSDERDCRSHYYLLREHNRIPAPVINHIHQGQFTQSPMLPGESCPDTHFLCPGEDVSCMPVFLRCNTIKDCPGAEDEAHCSEVTCPGYYRCRGSPVCLHPHHVCDGWPQCPERDDELLCHFSCPDECLCQGLAFVCYDLFDTTKYFDIRYLDGSQSSISSLNVSNMTYLTFLRLSSCNLDEWDNPSLINLRHLDLSKNQFSSIPVEPVLSTKIVPPTSFVKFPN